MHTLNIHMYRMHKVTSLQQLDLNLLKVFDALMREGSVSKAAARVYLSQSATSHALNRLRQALNDPLLVRTPKGMIPTQRAHELAPIVQTLLQQLQLSLENEQEFNPNTSQRRFILRTTDYVECVILPPLMAYLKQHAPGISIEVEILGSDIPEEQMASGDIDLLLGFSGYMAIPKHLEETLWWQDDLVALGSKEYFNQHEPLTMEALADHAYVYHSPMGTRKSIIDHWLESKGITRSIAVTSQSYLSAASIVSKTPYILMLPMRVAQQLINALPLNVMTLPSEAPKAQLNWIRHPIKSQDKGLDWLIQQITSHAV